MRDNLVVITTIAAIIITAVEFARLTFEAAPHQEVGLGQQGGGGRASPLLSLPLVLLLMLPLDPLLLARQRDGSLEAAYCALHAA
jgi:hypothetical protein